MTPQSHCLSNGCEAVRDCRRARQLADGSACVRGQLDEQPGTTAPLDSSAASEQKLVSATFQTPSWRIAVPFWLASMGVPLTVIV
jgi:hypothetical protein